MRFFFIINIGDSHTTLCGCWRPTNRAVCTVVGAFQLLVILLSLSQHVYSVIAHHHIFQCQSNITLAEATVGELVMAWDIIIYDFGLFNYLLGTSECIANYLDGGYGRCMWCCGHVFTLVIMYVVLLSERHQTRPWMLVPVLLHQSIYSLGLMILILATIPKMVIAIGYSATMELFELLVWYIAGSMCTWFFTSVLWHYYWLLDDQIELRRKVEKEALAKSKMETIKGAYATTTTVNTRGMPRVVTTVRDMERDLNENHTHDTEPELDYGLDELTVDEAYRQVPDEVPVDHVYPDGVQRDDVAYTTVGECQITAPSYDNQVYAQANGYNYSTPSNSCYNYSNPANNHSQHYSATNANYNASLYGAGYGGAAKSAISYRNPQMTQSYHGAYTEYPQEPITYPCHQSTYYFPSSQQVGVNYTPSTQNNYSNQPTSSYIAQTCYRNPAASNRSYYLLNQL